jgi:hypothetical protein
MKKYYVRFNKAGNTLESAYTLTGEKPRGYGWKQVGIQDCCTPIVGGDGLTNAPGLIFNLKYLNNNNFEDIPITSATNSFSVLGNRVVLKQGATNSVITFILPAYGTIGLDMVFAQNSSANFGSISQVDNGDGTVTVTAILGFDLPDFNPTDYTTENELHILTRLIVKTVTKTNFLVYFFDALNAYRIVATNNMGFIDNGYANIPLKIYWDVAPPAYQVKLYFRGVVVHTYAQAGGVLVDTISAGMSFATVGRFDKIEIV